MIVTLTLNPAVDKSCTVKHVVPEHKLSCQHPQFDAGGGGLNVARAIHAMGGTSLALWTCGGFVGQLLQQTLDKEGVIHQPLPVQDMTRENLIVYEESSGQQFRFGMPGARMTVQEVDRCIATIGQLDPQPTYLVLSGSLPPGVEEGLYARIAQTVSSNCRVIVDTRELPLKRSLEVPLYLIKPNLRELSVLAGREIREDSDIDEACRELIRAGKVEVIVTSIGSGGVFLFTKDNKEIIRAPTVKIRSKVGAGDSMVGGIVLSLSQGKPISDAVRFGVAAGSATVMTEGTQLCRNEDVRRLYEEMISAKQ